MKKITTFVGIISLLSVVFSELHAQPEYNLAFDTTFSIKQLCADFENTPAEARLRCYWWWLDRIAGDCQLPPEERRLNYIPRQAPQLQPSGLLVPVRIFDYGNP